MPISLDEVCVEAVLEQVAGQLVSAIEPLRVDAVEIPHPVRQIVAGTVDQEVEVVSHEAVRSATPSMRSDDASEKSDELSSVPIVAEDRLLPVAACRYVIDTVVELYPGSPRHDPTVQPALAAERRGAAFVTRPLAVRDVLGTVPGERPGVTAEGLVA
jgi:hypothetical protein